MNHREATRAKECYSVPVTPAAMETQATYSSPSLPLHTVVNQRKKAGKSKRLCFSVVIVMLQLCLSPTSPLSGFKFPILGSSYARRKPTSKHTCSSPTRLTISNSCESDSFSTSVAAIVFGDGSESGGLYPLTRRRSEGAIPMAGNYRLIDIVVSNCINSNINKIYALTQYNSTSLNSHLSRAYSNTGWGREGFLEVVAAYKSLEEQEWFKGTADAIRRSLWVLEEHPVMEFLVLPGHHLYKMDYQDLVLAHRNSSADITIAFSRTGENEDPGFGFLKVSSKNEVLDYKEKPEWVSQNPPKSESKRKWTEDSGYMGSMGIYVIKRDVMMKLLTELFPKAKDFGNDMICGAISMGLKVEAYLHEGYWDYFSNMEAYYHANIDCTKKKPSQFDFFDRDAPVYTLPRYLPPSSITNAFISDSVIGDGCILNNCKIRGSVIGMRTLVGNGAEIEDSVIMGSDIYQTDDQDVNGKHGEEIPFGIGEQSQIRKAIIDKHARIGKNVRIVNIDNVQEGDRQASGYVIRGGIVIVLGSALIPDGTIL